MFVLILKKGVKNSLSFLLILFCLTINSQAQKNNEINDSDKINLLYFTNHVSINIIPQIVAKASIKRTAGNYEMKASPQPGLEIVFNYYYNINRTYSVIFGLHGGIAGRNFLLHIPKEDFNPPAKADEDYNGALSRDIDLIYLSIPLFFEKRWASDKKRFWNADIGFNIRYSLQNYLEISEGYTYNTNSELVKVVSMQLNLGNNKPWINFNFGGGSSWIFDNNNIFRINLLFNISFKQFVYGKYQITVPSQPDTEGTYGVKGSSIGLSLSYIFTGANNTLRKMNSKKSN